MARLPVEMARTIPVCLLIGFAAAVSTVKPKPISSFPVEIRQRNYVRLSTEKCDECMTMEDFYKSNRLGFVLFFEHALMGGHKYKEAIVSGWMQVCKDLRWSSIACGMVDMVTDRAYAERYIDPKTAPAHIVVRDGQPIMATKDQVDPLLAKPGDKKTMLTHLGALLKDEGTLDSLSLSVQVDQIAAVEKLAQKHLIVIYCFAHDVQRFADVFRAAVQDAVFGKKKLATTVDVDASLLTDSKGRKGKGAAAKEKEKARVAFVAVKGEAVGKNFGLGPGSIGAFVAGKPSEGSEQLKDTAKIGDKEALEIIERALTNGKTSLKNQMDAKKKNIEGRGDKKTEL